MAERIERDELRALIREALREALAHESPPPLRGRDREGGNMKSARLPSPTPDPSPQGGGGNALRFDGSVLTETKVRDAAGKHATIVVGPDVAITPLARDKARELKISIERQKP
jgi:hypothetical protein